MPKVSQEHSDAQREAILNAAIRCFSREGFHRATMRDVVRESGVSAGALYVYFKSKDELIEAIAESRHLRERQWITSALDKSDLAASLRALLRAFGRALIDPDEREERRLSVQLWAEALRSQRVRESVLAGVDGPGELLTRLLKAAQKRGEFPRSLDCQAASRVLIALFQGVVLQMAWDPNLSITPYVKVVEAMLLALIEKSRVRPR
jgi:TetR/AcrR family transcriptional regulator, transcriptional repressor of aconitase